MALRNVAISDYVRMRARMSMLAAERSHQGLDGELPM